MANIKDWSRLYKRRARVVKSLSYNKHLIDHCGLLEFDCPHVYERLVFVDHEHSKCNNCRRNVKRVRTVPELRTEQELGNCVSQFYFYEEDEDDEGFGLFD